ncbi:MAG: TrkA-C domain protein [Candidatus Thorarchaeota archaeon]|nr:MAG: TrkA-C domain protein [Candidatus Thorarchaeota archaeon]
MQIVSMELTLVLIILFVTLILFTIGRLRYDVVALMALLAVVIVGAVPFDQAFLGFGHPAVITVAAVLIISRGMINSGFIDSIARLTSRVGERPLIQVMALTGLATVLSTFMNNIGALAILMPVAIRMANKSDISPSIVLMPLAFGSMMGGLITLIGTPPNIIIALFRGQDGGQAFMMFDYAPVGIGVAFAGFLFLSLVGWKILPHRIGDSGESIALMKEFVTELSVPEDSKFVGKRIRDLEEVAKEDVAIIALVRNGNRIRVPSTRRKLRAGDGLIVRGHSDELKMLVDAAELELVGKAVDRDRYLESDEATTLEAVISSGSLMEGQNAKSLKLHANYGANLLAIARQGRRLSAQLGSIRFKIGDVLLLQIPTDKLDETLITLGCLPLVERDIRLGKPRQVFLSVGIFGIAITLTILNILPVQISFVLAALGMILTGVITPNDAYKSINWPVVILIGAMIPVGEALENTGGTQLIANMLLELGGSIDPIFALVIILLVSLLLSAILNNAAVAILMAPIAIDVALALGVSIDPFLMALAIGASSDFLTPFGNHSCTLVMGPGGYKFSDYLRVGIPLSLIVIAVSIPLILIFWPL